MTNDNFAHQGGLEHHGGTREQATQQAGEIRDHAAREVADVKDHAVGATKDVAQTAGTEAKAVARDARNELRGLVNSGLDELNTQAGTGQQQLAAGLRNVVDELGEMVQGSTRNGMATQFARELSDRGNGLVGWLEGHEPRDALTEVRRYASRNPWTFLAIAAGAGLLVGRFARGLKDDGPHEQAYASGYAQPPQAYPATGDYRTPGYGTTPAQGVGTGIGAGYVGDSLGQDFARAGEPSEVQSYRDRPVDDGYPTTDAQGYGATSGPFDDPDVRR